MWSTVHSEAFKHQSSRSLKIAESQFQRRRRALVAGVRCLVCLVCFLSPVYWSSVKIQLIYRTNAVLTAKAIMKYKSISKHLWVRVFREKHWIYKYSKQYSCFSEQTKRQVLRYCWREWMSITTDHRWLPLITAREWSSLMSILKYSQWQD